MKCEVWRFGWIKGNCGVMTEKGLEEGYWMYRETGRLKIGRRELYECVNVQV